MQNNKRIVNGTLFAWGKNSKYHQCGQEEETKNVHEPTKIEFSQQNIIQVRCGDEHTLFLTGTKNL